MGTPRRTVTFTVFLLLAAAARVVVGSTVDLRTSVVSVADHEYADSVVVHPEVRTVEFTRCRFAKSLTITLSPKRHAPAEVSVALTDVRVGTGTGGSSFVISAEGVGAAASVVLTMSGVVLVEPSTVTMDGVTIRGGADALLIDATPSTPSPQAFDVWFQRSALVGVTVTLKGGTGVSAVAVASTVLSGATLRATGCHTRTAGNRYFASFDGAVLAGASRFVVEDSTVAAHGMIAPGHAVGIRFTGAPSTVNESSAVVLRNVSFSLTGSKRTTSQRVGLASGIAGVLAELSGLEVSNVTFGHAVGGNAIQLEVTGGAAPTEVSVLDAVVAPLGALGGESQPPSIDFLNGTVHGVGRRTVVAGSAPGTLQIVVGWAGTAPSLELHGVVPDTSAGEQFPSINTTAGLSLSFRRCLIPASSTLLRAPGGGGQSKVSALVLADATIVGPGAILASGGISLSRSNLSSCSLHTSGASTFQESVLTDVAATARTVSIIGGTVANASVTIIGGTVAAPAKLTITGASVVDATVSVANAFMSNRNGVSIHIGAGTTWSGGGGQGRCALDVVDTSMRVDGHRPGGTAFGIFVDADARVGLGCRMNVRNVAVELLRTKQVSVEAIGVAWFIKAVMTGGGFDICVANTSVANARASPDVSSVVVVSESVPGVGTPSTPTTAVRPVVIAMNLTVEGESLSGAVAAFPSLFRGPSASKRLAALEFRHPGIVAVTDAAEDDARVLDRVVGAGASPFPSGERFLFPAAPRVELVNIAVRERVALSYTARLSLYDSTVATGARLESGGVFEAFDSRLVSAFVVAASGCTILRTGVHGGTVRCGRTTAANGLMLSNAAAVVVTDSRPREDGAAGPTDLRSVELNNGSTVVVVGIDTVATNRAAVILRNFTVGDDCAVAVRACTLQANGYVGGVGIAISIGDGLILWGANATLSVADNVYLMTGSKQSVGQTLGTGTFLRHEGSPISVGGAGAAVAIVNNTAASPHRSLLEVQLAVTRAEARATDVSPVLYLVANRAASLWRVDVNGRDSSTIVALNEFNASGVRLDVHVSPAEGNVTICNAYHENLLLPPDQIACADAVPYVKRCLGVAPRAASVVLGETVVACPPLGAAASMMSGLSAAPAPSPWPFAECTAGHALWRPPVAPATRTSTAHTTSTTTVSVTASPPRHGHALTPRPSGTPPPPVPSTRSASRTLPPRPPSSSPPPSAARPTSTTLVVMPPARTVTVSSTTSVNAGDATGLRRGASDTPADGSVADGVGQVAKSGTAAATVVIAAASIRGVGASSVANGARLQTLRRVGRCDANTGAPSVDRVEFPLMFSLPGVVDTGPGEEEGAGGEWSLAAGAALTNALLSILGAGLGVAAYQHYARRDTGHVHGQQDAPAAKEGAMIPAIAGVASVVLPAYAAPLTIGIAAEALTRVRDPGAVLFFATAAATALAAVAPVLWATHRAARWLPVWDARRGMPVPAAATLQGGGRELSNASALQTVFGHVVLGGLRSYPNPWFVRGLVAVEVGIATLLATATAIVPDCEARALVALVVTLGGVAYAAGARPLQSRLETTFNVAIAAVQCAAAVAAVLRAVVFSTDGDRASALAVLEVCVLVDALLLFAQPVVLVAWEMLGRRRAAEGGEGKEHAAISDALLVVPTPSVPPPDSPHDPAVRAEQRTRGSSQDDPGAPAPANPLLPGKS